MDCTGIADHLVGYHVGAVDESERDAVEAHLVECSACVRTYLALKRASDRAELERPRPEVRARLRAEVARAFPAPTRRSKVAFFPRSIPLYQGVGLAALAASIALAAPRLLERVSRMEGAAATASIDTSRTSAESLHIY
jgi:anti-sigma factor RsiW